MKKVKMKNSMLRVLTLFTALSVVFVSCDSEDDNMGPDSNDNKGQANIGVTDAAVDAENVTGVYLRVQGVKVDGDDNANDHTVMFDAAQEINLMAYQNGDVYDMTSLDLNAGSYSDISFILADQESAFVKFTDNTTADIDLEGTVDNEYEIVGDFEIIANSTTDLVADIDLRKALHESSANGEFMLRSTARLVEVSTTGTIEGSIENYNELKSEMESEGTEAQVVVYAYLKGEFDEMEREDPDGDGLQGRFENSINSAVVQEDGTFTLAFMNDAEYEITVGSYEKADDAPEDAPYMFQNLLYISLFSETNLGLFVDDIDVNANAETNISLKLDW
ncbi:MAG: DUF4382 domain-containing protein [Cyclobacteriaceae bacterium]